MSKSFCLPGLRIGWLVSRDRQPLARIEGGALLVPTTLFDLDDQHLRVGLDRPSFPQALARWEAAGPCASIRCDSCFSAFEPDVV